MLPPVAGSNFEAICTACSGFAPIAIAPMAYGAPLPIAKKASLIGYLLPELEYR